MAVSGCSRRRFRCRFGRRAPAWARESAPVSVRVWAPAWARGSRAASRSATGVDAGVVLGEPAGRLVTVGVRRAGAGGEVTLGAPAGPAGGFVLVARPVAVGEDGSARPEDPGAGDAAATAVSAATTEVGTTDSPDSPARTTVRKLPVGCPFRSGPDQGGRDTDGGHPGSHGDPSLALTIGPRRASRPVGATATATVAGGLRAVGVDRCSWRGPGYSAVDADRRRIGARARTGHDGRSRHLRSRGSIPKAPQKVHPDGAIDDVPQAPFGWLVDLALPMGRSARRSDR